MSRSQAVSLLTFRVGSTPLVKWRRQFLWFPVHRAFSAAAVSEGGNMDTPKQFSTYSRKTCSRV